MSTMMDIVDPKDPIQVPYCEPKNMRPLTTYTLFKDLNARDFVLARSHDSDLVFFFGWEEWRVMLSRMKRVNIFKW